MKAFLTREAAVFPFSVKALSRNAARVASILLVCVAASFALEEITVRLSNGNTFTGTRSFENEKFLTINVNGSDIRILKSMIEEISIEIPRESTVSTERKPSNPADEKEPSISDVSGRVRSAEVEVLLVNPKDITWLDMSFERLSELNPRVSLLSNLTYLDLKGNSLTELPESIGDLTSLRVLDLRFNKLRKLPPHIGNLTGLQYLYLSENRFSHSELARLERLLPSATVVHTPGVEKKKGKPLPFTVKEGEYADSLRIACQNGKVDACLALAEFWFGVNDWERGILACEWGCPLDRSELSSIAVECCEKAAELNANVRELPVRAAMYYKRICESSTPRSTRACIQLEKLR